MMRFTLNDGKTIPAIGFGVFMIPGDGPTYDAVLWDEDGGGIVWQTLMS